MGHRHVCMAWGHVDHWRPFPQGPQYERSVIGDQLSELSVKSTAGSRARRLRRLRAYEDGLQSGVFAPSALLFCPSRGVKFKQGLRGLPAQCRRVVVVWFR